jgi:hypothetical protein
MIAALYVDPLGCYAGLTGVDAWDMARDARRYAGPWPVVAHPPCQRWGRFAEGGPSAPGTRKTGDDGGCFAAALAAVRTWGGVLEHPKDSKAWPTFGLSKPPYQGGWILADVGAAAGPGWTCCVSQGHYGHFSNKPTWLYAVGPRPGELVWGKGPNTLPQAMIERYGYERARRIGVMAMVGGKDKTRIREATPPAFRDVLLNIARATRDNPLRRVV